MNGEKMTGPLDAGMRLEGDNAGLPACLNGLKLFELQNKG